MKKIANIITKKLAFALFSDSSCLFITYTKPEEWLTAPICKLEKLDFIENETNGRKKKTFSIMSDEEEVSLLIDFYILQELKKRIL